jgi:uncharacterized OB-fold protein
MSEQKPAHSAPLSNRDFDFFYEGLEAGQLLIQRCCDCQALRAPPGPRCLACGSPDWNTIASKGRGRLFSYTVHHHPPLPGFEMPHPIGLVDLDEGVRMLAAMDGVAPENIAIGMALEAEFIRRGAMATFRFREAVGQGAAS